MLRNGIMEKENFSILMENEARDLVKNIRHKNDNLSLTSLLEQEIALTVEQIDKLRQLNKDQFRSLLRTECYIGTDLMQMEERLPHESPLRFAEKDKFHLRLQAVEAERRKLSIFYEEKMRMFQRQLLGLMQKHGQLSIHKYVKR